MKLQLFDCVKLKSDDLKHNVKTTDIGTIVDVLNNGEAFTVEFLNSDNQTIEDALYTSYTSDQLIKI